MTGRPRIAVVDYGAGNIVSIDQALTTVGAEVVLARDGDALRNADAVIVPGVGAAEPAMARLDRRGLTSPIRAWLAADRPFLGICLGLQLLFDGSDEDGAVTLGILPGRTVRLEGAPTLPHIGWNQVERTRAHPLFDGIAAGADFYFVHSFVGVPAGARDVVAAGARGVVPAGARDDVVPAGARDDVVLATTWHGRSFASAISRGTLLGVQFHPERSGPDGLRLLANFVDLVRAA